MSKERKILRGAFFVVIFIISLVGFIIATSTTAKADYNLELVEQELIEEQMENELTTQTGVGLGINVITAESLTDFKTGYSILDYTALEDLPKNKINYNRNAASFWSTTDERQVILSFNNSVEVSAGVDLFLFAVETQFLENTTFDYLSYSYHYYNTYYHNISKYNLYIQNYLNKNTYSNAFSTSYLADLQALVDEELTYESFFNRYGTHLVGSAILGGKLYATYSIVSNSVVLNESNEIYLRNHTTFPIGQSNYLAQIASVLSNQTTNSVNVSDFNTNFRVFSQGGNVFTSGTVGNFETQYNAWCNSFSEESASVIVDYTSDGLVPLWEILPDAYSFLEEDMLSAYTTISANTVNNFMSQFETDDYIHFSGGKGTASEPYLISTAQQLRNIESVSMVSYYKMLNDINISGQQWNSLGGFYKQKKFYGVLDGDGYAISGLTRTTDIQEQDNRIYFGLFGCVAKEESTNKTGTIKNITFTNVNINMSGPAVNNANTRVFVGVVAGMVHGGNVQNTTITSGACIYNCCTNGISYVGAITGLAREANIYNCTNIIPLTSGRYGGVVGGIAGYIYNSTISFCSNYGNLNAYGTGWGGHACAGGIVGLKNNDTAYPSTLMNNTNYGTLSTAWYGWGIGFTSYVGQEVGFTNSDNYY